MEEIVFPGTFLCTEEEFLPDENSFVDDKGNVKSTVVGMASWNNSSKKMNVLKNNSKNVLETGSIVLGRIALVKDNMLLVQLIEAEKNGKKQVLNQTFGSVMIFNVSSGYVSSTRDVARIGDIIKAKVIEITSYSIELSLNEKGLGVMKAYCIKCRSPLMQEGSSMKCTECGNIEKRKIAEEYTVK